MVPALFLVDYEHISQKKKKRKKERKKICKRQRRKGKIYPFVCRVPWKNKDR